MRADYRENSFSCSKKPGTRNTSWLMSAEVNSCLAADSEQLRLLKVSCWPNTQLTPSSLQQLGRAASVEPMMMNKCFALMILT